MSAMCARTDCYVGRNDKENIILCAGCNLPFCGPCVRAGRFVRPTGRFSWDWMSPTEAFCKACDDKRNKAAGRKR